MPRSRECPLLRALKLRFDALGDELREFRRLRIAALPLRGCSSSTRGRSFRYCGLAVAIVQAGKNPQDLDVPLQSDEIETIG